MYLRDDTHVVRSSQYVLKEMRSSTQAGTYKRRNALKYDAQRILAPSYLTMFGYDNHMTRLTPA